ncbi:MAG: DUF4276 family protein [Magnetococcales bacterium]|nr:DUF4276 family protein [Magnetococcales bacterium]
MVELVFFLEEPSAREMLDGLLPRILPEEITPRYVVFRGKRDLEKRLPNRLKNWLTPNARFIILQDQDRGSCIQIKRKLAKICTDSGKSDALVRIACRELESWYLGDLKAVENGLALTENKLSHHQNKKNLRTPDTLVKPAEELKRLTDNKYQKMAGSRAIGPHLDLEQNRSNSFRVFVSGVKKVAEGMVEVS